jgi:hypothetical protein
VPAATAKKGKKKKFNALSVDDRVLWYGGWTKEGKTMAIDGRAESRRAE